ncbi:MAG: hypothetical protein JXE06_10745 [Coriobacteriia bacterium]|nr:hypothetical protein [Coriobacteriia bacterium]MBN2822282.1 hypothetical protein [Coriobacteriia bacterium]
MRSVVVVLLLSMILTGCAIAPADETSSDVGHRNVVAAIDDGISPDDPNLARADESGRTPEDVVLAAIAAANLQDWETEYSLYATPNIDYEAAVAEWEVSVETYDSFAVHETRIIDEATALVRVSYMVETTPPGGDRYSVSVPEPGEWWALHKVDGVWLVQWMPKQ